MLTENPYTIKELNQALTYALTREIHSINLNPNSTVDKATISETNSFVFNYEKKMSNNEIDNHHIDAYRLIELLAKDVAREVKLAILFGDKSVFKMLPNVEPNHRVNFSIDELTLVRQHQTHFRAIITISYK